MKYFVDHTENDLPWQVRSENKITASRSFKTQKEAVKWAEGQIKKHAPATGGSIVVNQRNGRIRSVLVKAVK